MKGLVENRGFLHERPPLPLFSVLHLTPGHFPIALPPPLLQGYPNLANTKTEVKTQMGAWGSLVGSLVSFDPEPPSPLVGEGGGEGDQNGTS